MADPYADPYAATNTGITITPPSDYGAADAYNAPLDKYRTAFNEREKQREGVEAKQQLNVDQMSTLLEDAVKTIRKNREGRSNLPMMAFGAGMMGTPGDFGTQIGGGLRAMIPAVEKQRKEQDETEVTLANLGIKGGEIRNMPLKEKLDYLKALQTGDMATIRAIETAQIRAQATEKARAQKTSVEEQKFKMWQQSPGNEAKSYDDYLQEKALLGQRTPGEIQIQNQINKERKERGEPPLDYVAALEEINRRKAAATTTGRESAEAQVKAETAYGRTQQGIQKGFAAIDDLLKNDKDIDSYVGRAEGRVTANAPWTTQERQNFANKHQYLTSQLFTQAIQPLIGTGAGSLSDAEGKALAQGFANLQLTNDPEVFRKGLRELREQLRQTLEDAGRRSRGEPMKAPPAEAPAAGTPTAPAQSGPKPAGKPWEKY